MKPFWKTLDSVKVDPGYVESCGFEQGSLDGLVDGILGVLYTRIDLWSGAPLRLRVYGQRHEEGPYVQLVLGVHPRLSDLDAILQDNLPSGAGFWECDCSEYCDQNHGEGPIEVVVARPTGPELLLWARWKLQKEEEERELSES